MSGPEAPAGADRGADRRRPRIAYLAYWTTEHDSRLERMVRTSLADGWDVVVYGRLMPGQEPVEQRDGYRVIRAPADPSFRALFGRRPAAATPARRSTPSAGPPSGAPVDEEDGQAGRLAIGQPTATARAGTPPRGIRGLARRAAAGSRFAGAYTAARRRWHGLRRWILHPRERLEDRRRAPRRWLLFLEQISGWAMALDRVAEPADVWHGMSIGALPAVLRQRRRLGGRTVYDALDIYLHARSMEHAHPVKRRLHAAIERRWAHRADAVVTVNEGCAEVLERELGVTRPLAVLNCPEWTPPIEPRPDLIRERLGLARSTRVVLYHGGLLSERGIEQGMDAVLELGDAAFVVLGYGPLRDAVAERAGRPPYAGRVHLLDAVRPSELLAWTSSADAILVAIQPTTLNHRLATPNKLFEAMMSGVPVVAADLPEMARIVTATGCGVLCDPTEPAAIAAALRAVLDAPDDERAAFRARALAAARETYHWEAQSGALLAFHRALLPTGRTSASGPSRA